MNKRLEAEAGDIKFPDVQQYTMFDFENEDEEFLNDFNRVVSDEHVPHADDVYNNGKHDEAD